MYVCMYVCIYIYIYMYLYTPSLLRKAPLYHIIIVYAIPYHTMPYYMI